MKEETPVIAPSNPDAPPDPNGRPSQASAVARFYVCPWPDFYSVMNDCDREVYQWIEQIPWNSRPGYLSSEQQRIANAAYQQQYQQWSSCESGRYAGQTQPEPGLRLAVASRLAGGGIVRDDSASAGVVARLSVPFAPGSAPPPPTPCPSIPFHFLNRVDKMGINYYPQNTVVEFSGQPSTYWSGIGPWEGAKVMIAWSLNGWSLWNVQNFFRMEARVRSQKVFDHWVSFKAISNPAPPASLVARSEPFNLESLQVQTSVPYNWNAPEGQRGQGWHMFVEYTHVESGQSWVLEQWLETYAGWNPVGLGGYGFDQAFYHYLPGDLAATGEADGTWVHRVCVYDFKRMPTAVSVLYNGVQVESGVSSITPLMTTPYVPGVSAGIASVDETVTVHTVGATKASFRILGVEPVPGFGVRFTIKVVNELHFAACIVTPFLSGIGDRTSWQDNVMHFYMPAVWVVRNLGAHSESGPISILVPMHIVETGDWPLRDLHWRLFIAQEAYPAPLNQFADGVYGPQHDSNGNPVSPYANIGNWPPPGYKISSNPEQYAFLLAGYLENGDKVWHSPWDSTVDTNRLLLTMPVRKAPGTEVPYVRDPRFGNIDYPTYFDQVPFLGFVEWTAEYKVSNNPEVWESRSGSSSIGLDLTTAIARYGRYLCRYIDISRSARAKYLGPGPGKAGATYIDLFCGPGRCKVRDTGEWIDGGVVAAWKKSQEGGAPFTQVFIGDLDTQRREAAATRLRQLGAPVVEIDGAAVNAVQQVIARVNVHGLHFAFLDPFDLAALNFDIIVALSSLKRIDMLVHISQMDLQRNLVSYATKENSPFDAFAPGWREKVSIVQGQQELRQQIFQFWRDKVAELGVWPSENVRLLTGSKNQPLYWLLMAAKHALPHKFWATASNVEGQGKLDF